MHNACTAFMVFARLQPYDPHRDRHIRRLDYVASAHKIAMPINNNLMQAMIAVNKEFGDG